MKKKQDAIKSVDNAQKNDLSTMLCDLIDEALIKNQKTRKRNYIGGSQIGITCSRAIQLDYAGASLNAEITGRTLRIFDVGHIFEQLVVHYLDLMGLKFLQTSGQQFGFKALNGKFRGHVDGIIAGAPVELGWNFPMLFETKSLNSRSWRDLAKKGVAKSKPVYASQIAIYQAYMEAEFEGITQNPALFSAINKDTCELYFELIPFNAQLAQNLSDKAVNIIKALAAEELLPRIAKDEDYYECKLCRYSHACWNKDDFSRGICNV